VRRGRLTHIQIQTTTLFLLGCCVSVADWPFGSGESSSPWSYSSVDVWFSAGNYDTVKWGNPLCRGEPPVTPPRCSVRGTRNELTGPVRGMSW
jgi:hypothetical protein